MNARMCSRSDPRICIGMGLGFGSGEASEQDLDGIRGGPGDNRDGGLGRILLHCQMWLLDSMTFQACSLSDVAP